jgi:hypothetical protein
MSGILGRRQRADGDALHQGPRKKAYAFFVYSNFHKLTDTSRAATDPLVHHGRHFGRTVHTFCNINTLIANGLLRMGDPDRQGADTSA